jgi:hypothetical protein
MLANALDDLAYLLLMGGEPVGRKLPAHGGGIQHAMAQQAVILAGHETGLVSPVFEEIAIGQQLLQPARLVLAEPAEQHQIGAARHHRDGVYLQQRHAANSRQQIGRGRFAATGGKQALGRQLQMTGVLQREMGDRHEKPLLGFRVPRLPPRRGSQRQRDDKWGK